jgi:p-hydroxybenzoate 3-monooxygenase
VQVDESAAEGAAMRKQVAIIGGGPAGLLLSQLLHRSGIDAIVLERRSRAYVMSRIRAGVLEAGTVDLLREIGLGERMDREGLVHHGCFLAAANRQFRVDFAAGCGRTVMVYGQTELTRDLYDAQDAAAATLVDEAENVALHGLDRAAPYITYSKNGAELRVDCEFIAGCDGYHGISRQSIPASARTEFAKTHPFGWLGVLSSTPPVADELIYANSPRGFALASMRNPNLSRYYIQVPLSDRVENWTDRAFWDELRRRLPAEAADRLITGDSIEKSIAPLRSFISEPMQWERLFLCGDAAHIVPPTGAKGLNLAVSDVYYLHEAFRRYYHDEDPAGLKTYSYKALRRVWKATRFSWWMTDLMHRLPEQNEFEQRIQESELDYIGGSGAAQAAMAENYTGLPFDDHRDSRQGSYG